jgi:hypothetical protein
LDELDEKSNHTKMSKSSNFEGKGCKAKDSFKKPFDKKKLFNGFKIPSFRCKSHVQEIILPKNIFGCPLKLILGFFAFLAINKNIHIQLCMNMKTHHCHMNYFKLE